MSKKGGAKWLPRLFFRSSEKEEKKKETTLPADEPELPTRYKVSTHGAIQSSPNLEYPLTSSALSSPIAQRLSSLPESPSKEHIDRIVAEAKRILSSSSSSRKSIPAIPLLISPYSLFYSSYLNYIYTYIYICVCVCFLYLVLCMFSPPVFFSPQFG